MSQLAFVRDLYRHMQWADAEIWRALAAKPEVLSDPQLLDLVRHIHSVQRSFLLMWTNTPLDQKDIDGQREPDVLRERARSYYAEADAFLTRVEPEMLSEIVVMPWLQHFAERLGRPLQAPTLADTLLQLPAHSTYHRGQANLRLRELGGEPPLVDYIAWVWFGRPEPHW